MAENGKTYKVWEPLLFGLVAAAGLWAGTQFARVNHSSAPVDTTFSKTKYSGRQVEEIIRFLETKYVGDVSSDDLVQKAIDAIMSGLDPHTHYFPPDQMDELEERTMGNYVGIGIEIAFLNDSLVILYPKKNSPAEKAGIMPGDYIVAINDIPVPQDTLDEKKIIDLIKGQKGTKVRLLLKPILSDTTHEVSIIRDEIHVPSVPSAYMIDTAVAYIKIDRFIQSTYGEFMDHWEELYEKENARDLILDLRENPGGYLKEAVNMLSQFFAEQGRLLVYTEGKHQERYEYKSTGKVFFPFRNICVLINGGSASASEIVAGCLQDQDRALILGTRSYGKGLVQEQFDLSNGGVLRMTVARYYTPSGRLIQKAYDTLTQVDTVATFLTSHGRPVHAGGGIQPDVEIHDPVDWMDPALRSWMDLISEYAIRYTAIHFQGKIVPLEQIPALLQQLPSSAEMMQGLTALAVQRYPGEKSDSLLAWSSVHPDIVTRVAASSVIAYRTGEAGWYIAFNEKDPVIKKAMETIHNDALMALKSEK